MNEWIILSSQSRSKMKNTNYWYLLIFKNYTTLFRRFCQSRSRAYFKGLFRIRKNFVERKIFCRSLNILRWRYTKKQPIRDFKKCHKINTGIFYRKNADFFPINVLYKIFQIFNQRKSWKLPFTEKSKNFEILRLE